MSDIPGYRDHLCPPHNLSLSLVELVARLFHPFCTVLPWYCTPRTFGRFELGGWKVVSGETNILMAVLYQNTQHCGSKCTI